MAKNNEIEVNGWTIFKIVILAAFVIGLLVVIFGSVYIVSAGERGVVLSWGRVQEIPSTEGLHFKVPIKDEVVKIDIKTQKYEAPASAASRDLQIVSTNIAVNFHLEGSKTPELYKTVGLSYGDRLIQPAVQEVVKASTAQYNAEELITRRPEVKDLIKQGLIERLGSRGIVIEEVSLTDFDFSDSFNAAIEAKVTAEQNALAEKNRLAEIEYRAQQRVTQAEGEASAIKAQAEAIRAQGGSEYVQLQWIEKWNGQMPNIVLGDGAKPLINLGNQNNLAE